MGALDLLTRGLRSASGLSLVTKGLLGGAPQQVVVISQAFADAKDELGDLKVDMRLLFSPENFEADLQLFAGDLAADDTLETAILLSLFTDARATEDELVRFGGADPRGFWGDSLAEIEGDRFGSKLWLLAREKQTAETLNRARDYATEALAWLIEDGIADEVPIEADYPQRGLLALGVEVVQARVPRQRFAFVWAP